MFAPIFTRRPSAGIVVSSAGEESLGTVEFASSFVFIDVLLDVVELGFCGGVASLF